MYLYIIYRRLWWRVAAVCCLRDDQTKSPYTAILRCSNTHIIVERVSIPHVYTTRPVFFFSLLSYVIYIYITSFTSGNGFLYRSSSSSSSGVRACVRGKFAHRHIRGTIYNSRRRLRCRVVCSVVFLYYSILPIARACVCVCVRLRLRAHQKNNDDES